MLCEFGLKMPIHAPFSAVFGEFDPLDETQYQPISQSLYGSQRFQQLLITYAGVWSSSEKTALTKRCDKEEEEHEFLGVFGVFLK